MRGIRLAWLTIAAVVVAERGLAPIMAAAVGSTPVIIRHDRVAGLILAPTPLPRGWTSPSS